MRIRLCLLALLGTLLVACRPPALTMPRHGDPVSPVASVRAAEEARAVIRVRWPQRTTQLIPSATERLVVTEQPLSDPSASRSITLVRPATDTQSVATFEHLAPGNTVFSAEARDASDRVLAAGSSTVTLRPNELAPVSLVLGSAVQPTLQTVYPINGVPGDFVSLVGAGFGATAEASFSVSVGALVVPGSMLERVNDSLIVMRVPDVAPAAAVTVTVGSKSAVSSALFTPIASLSLTPSATETFAPFGRVRFTTTAFDLSGAPIPNPSIFWQPSVDGCDTAGCFPGKLDSDGVFTAGEEDDGLGTVRVQVGRPPIVAVATVHTHEISPADVPAGFGSGGAVRVPEGNPQTAAKIALGKRLFFDPGLSSTGQLSCASCHLPNEGFTVSRPQPLGNDGQPLARNAPTVLDVGRLAGPFFWDGRAATLEDQAIGVFNSPRELNMSEAAVAAYLGASPEYVASFLEVFGAAPSRDRTVQAIAAFERSLVTAESPFERWLKGDTSAIDDDEEGGLGLFLGKGSCITCHSGPMLTDEQFHNIAIPGSGTTDPGLKGITGLAADAGRFRTPSLRNVALTGPYFHDGSKATLREAILHYEQFDKQFPNVDAQMPQVVFTPEDLDQLEAFLHAVGGATPSF